MRKRKWGRISASALSPLVGKGSPTGISTHALAWSAAECGESQWIRSPHGPTGYTVSFQQLLVFVGFQTVAE